MYASTIVENTYGDPPKVRKLSPVETLKRLYPTIILKRKERIIDKSSDDDFYKLIDEIINNGKNGIYPRLDDGKNKDDDDKEI